MTTNPAALMRVLITYAICIPLAILMGYILTDVGNSANHTNLFIVGSLIGVALLPIFIKWHYPIMLFGLSCPMTVFFLVGSPPLWEIVVILSLAIAIIERAANSKNRFLSAPSIVWPLIFTVAMALFTAKLTGGIGLHTLGGDVGGGKKYLTLFFGVAVFFALISRRIPEKKRSFYIMLFILPGVFAFISDLGPVLPYPINYINFLFPSGQKTGESWEIGTTRLGGFGAAAAVVVSFMLARFGLRGIFSNSKTWWRAPLFILMFAMTLLGGFRNVIFSYFLICFLMFFMEGLHRTKLLPIFVFLGILGVALLVPLSNKLPYTFQRAISFLPVNVDASVKADAEDSSEWRFKMWHDLWPQVPGYLLLGKGYALNANDFQMIGEGTLANGAEASMDASEGALAVAGDYHSGPLSTIIPFGIWGAITFLWFTLAGLRVLYRNLKYGGPELRIANTFLFAQYLTHYISFFFIFGSYANDIGLFAGTIGFSIALNGGVLGPKSKLKSATSATVHEHKPLPQTRPQLA